jgi:hypothetical protein
MLQFVTQVTLHLGEVPGHTVTPHGRGLRADDHLEAVAVQTLALSVVVGKVVCRVEMLFNE